METDSHCLRDLRVPGASGDRGSPLLGEGPNLATPIPGKGVRNGGAGGTDRQRGIGRSGMVGDPRERSTTADAVAVPAETSVQEGSSHRFLNLTGAWCPDELIRHGAQDLQVTVHVAILMLH